MARDLRLGMVIEAVDRASKPLQKISGAVDRFGRTSGLNKLGRQLGVVQTRFGRVGDEGVRTLRNVAAAGTAAAGALLLVTKGYASAAANVVDVADKLGVSVEWLQKQRYAFEQNGVAQRIFDMGLQRVTRRVAEAVGGTGEAREALAWLELQLTDTEGRARSMEELLPEIADKLAAIEDPALAVRVAFKLFDSEGVALLGTLNKGSEWMARTAEEAEKLGIVMSEDAARAGKKFDDQWLRTTRVLTGLRDAIGYHLLPVFEPMLRKLQELTTSNRPELVERIGDAVAALGANVEKSRAAIARAVDAVRTWYNGMDEGHPIRRVIDAVRDWIDRNGWLAASLTLVAGVISFKLIVAVAALSAAILKLTAISLANPWILLAAAVAFTAYQIITKWDEIVVGIRSRIGLLKLLFKGLGNVLWLYLVQKPKQWGSDMVDALLEGIKAAWGRITAWFDQAVAAMLDVLPDWLTDQLGAQAPVVDLPPSLQVAAAAPGAALYRGPAAAATGGRAEVGGRLRVEVADDRVRVTNVESDNPDVPLEVTSGYSLAGL